MSTFIAIIFSSFTIYCTNQLKLKKNKKYLITLKNYFKKKNTEVKLL